MGMTPAWSARVKPLIGLAIVFALALLLRWPVAAMPLERDEGEYAYIAQRWIQGEVPYKETFDQKPPGTFALYVLFITCVGSSPAAIHWGMHLYTLGTVALVYWLGKRLFTGTAGLMAAALCAFMTSAPCVLGQSANTEMAMLLPLTAGLAATLCAVERTSARWSFLAGVCAAAALLCKQVALFPVAIYPLLLFLGAGAGRWRMLGALVLGGVAPLALVLGYFLWQGAWHEFYDCVIGHNLSYANRLPLYLYPLRFLRTFLWIAVMFGPIYYLAVAAVRRGWGLRPDPNSPRPAALLTLWLILCFFAVSVGGRFFEHYFVITIPATALLGGIGTDILTRKDAGSRLKILRPEGVVTFAISLGLLLGFWYYSKNGTPEAKSRQLYKTDLFVASTRVSQFIAEDSRPDDRVFVLGSEPELLYYAGRKSASRYIFSYPLMGITADARQRQRGVLQELTDQPPEFIVIVFRTQYLWDSQEAPTDWCDGVVDLVSRSYEVEMVQPFDQKEPASPLTGREARERWDKHFSSYQSAENEYCIVVYRRSCPDRSQQNGVGEVVNGRGRPARPGAFQTGRPGSLPMDRL